MYFRTKFTLPNLTIHRVTARRMPRPTFQEFLLKFGLVLFIALIFTAADAFSFSSDVPMVDGRSECAMMAASE